mgnify:CR=1 FL=1
MTQEQRTLSIQKMVSIIKSGLKSMVNKGYVTYFHNEREYTVYLSSSINVINLPRRRIPKRKADVARRIYSVYKKQLSKEKRRKQMIEVIDSIMGSGKSTWMINYINSHPEQQYLIVVPYLSEVSRYETTLKNFKGFQPKNRPGGKISDFKELVASGKNIITTHALIKNIDRECLDLLKVQNYSLVLDESMQVIEEYPIPQSDLKIILDNEYIKISDNGFIIWNNENAGAKEYKGKWLKEN